MIPSLLDELKEGRFKLHSTRGMIITTESGWSVSVGLLKSRQVLVNSRKVSWLFAWRIRRAIKKGLKNA